MKTKLSLLGLALGLALLVASTETSQAQQPYQGIYKCTISWKGDYKYYDGIFPELTGYCERLRGTSRGYIVNRGNFYDIIFWDRRNKEFSAVTDCVWDCATQYSCGRKQDKIEVCFSSCKQLTITDGNLDIERCEIICLGGRAKDRQLGTRANPYIFSSISTLKGTSCRQSCYYGGPSKDCFLPLTEGKRDFAYDIRGLTAGATSCISAKHSYRLDTKLTKEWVASGNFSDPAFGRMLVNSYLTDRDQIFLGAITADEWCELRNLTGVEPFMP